MTPSLRILACCLALVSASGCESLQRKFTRKPKGPIAKPSPIIKFQDYSQAITPEDRYRKHYMMFDYWNYELMDGLRVRPLNPKRYRKAADATLAELNALKGLLEDGPASKLSPLVDERSRIVQRLDGGFSEMQADALIRDLEAQARSLHRDFSPRDVKEILKDEPPAVAMPAEPRPAPVEDADAEPAAGERADPMSKIDAMPGSDAGSH